MMLLLPNYGLKMLDGMRTQICLIITPLTTRLTTPDFFSTTSTKTTLDIINRIIKQVDDKPGDSFTESSKGNERKTLVS